MSVIAALACASQARAAPFVYVTNAADGTVSQFDAPPASSGALRALNPATVTAGGDPLGVAVTPDGRNLYVTNNNDATVSQYSVGAGGRLAPKSPATVGTGSDPDAVAVSPDGKSVYLTNNDGTVSQYSVGAGGKLQPKTPATVITGSEPEGVAIRPNGKSVYVANFGDGTVSQYSVGAGGALSALTPATVATGSDPDAVVVSPNGKSVYVVSSADDTVSQYSVGAGGTLQPKTPATITTGKRPDAVAVSPDGKSVYVTNLFNGVVPGTISQYSVGSGGVLSHKSPATVKTGPEPEGIAVSPDGKSVYVTNFFFSTVSQYSVGAGGALSHKKQATVSAGSGPWGVAVGPDADVSLKIAAPGSVKHGAAISYTVTAKNAGPSRAWLVKLKDALPAGTEFLSASTSRGTCTTPPPKSKSGTLSCQLGTFAKGAHAGINVKVKVTATAGHTIRNRPRASSTTPDPKTTNNTAHIKTKVT